MALTQKLTKIYNSGNLLPCIAKNVKAHWWYCHPCVLLLLSSLVNVTRVDDIGTILMRNFNEQYCQQQGRGQANGGNILLIALARMQYSVEDPVP